MINSSITFGTTQISKFAFSPRIEFISIFICLIALCCSIIGKCSFAFFWPWSYTTKLFKGQLISKWFFGVVDFLQKMNGNKSTWGIIVVKSNSFVRFLEEIDDPKNHFEIIWPLVFSVKKSNLLKLCVLKDP